MEHLDRIKVMRYDKDRSNQRSFSGLTKKKVFYPEAIGSHCRCEQGGMSDLGFRKITLISSVDSMEVVMAGSREALSAYCVLGDILNAYRF